MMKKMFYGESNCVATKKNGEKCSNKAYYVGGKCGVHCRKDRVELPRNPDRQKNKEKEWKKHKASVEEVRRRGRGEIRFHRMRMMKEVPLVPGFLNVFPNYRHGKRKDGWGIPALSPMVLGPVEHGEKDWPPAKNLENYHQGAKVFPWEVDEEGNPTEEYWEKRREMYEDPVPHRHKAKGKPLFSLRLDNEGKEHRYNYLESRYFYCHHYELLAIATKEFWELKKLVDEGTNIMICGYDAYGGEFDDPSVPFGHESVIRCLLEEERPWSHKCPA